MKQTPRRMLCDRGGNDYAGGRARMTRYAGVRRHSILYSMYIGSVTVKSQFPRPTILFQNLFRQCIGQKFLVFFAVKALDRDVLGLQL
jgi:hypothetical protein